MLTPQQASALQFMLMQEVPRVRELLDTAHWAIVGMREIAEALQLTVDVPDVFNSQRAAGDLTALRAELIELLQFQSEEFRAVLGPALVKAREYLAP